MTILLNVLGYAIIMIFLGVFMLFIMAFVDLEFKINLIDDPDKVFEIIKNEKKKYKMIIKGLLTK